MPDVTIRRRLDGGYTVGLSGRGLLELSPQGLLYAREFWPTFKKRRKCLTFAIGRSFFEGPESLSRWTLDGVSPFERLRTLDPAGRSGAGEARARRGSATTIRRSRACRSRQAGAA